jgi:glutaminyl-peptide cyclotransferase
VSTLNALNWHIEEDSFSAGTPVGVKSFTNVIATHDPTAPRRIVLSAHFDSKYFARYPENQVRFFLLFLYLFGALVGDMLTNRSL